MQTKIISKFVIHCDNCESEISCNIPSHLAKAVQCPICGDSLHSKFDEALKSAINYNKAVMDIIQCQREHNAEFGD